MPFVTVSGADINLSADRLSNAALVSAAQALNDRLIGVSRGIGRLSLQVFDIMDLRMLSGLMGEMFVAELCRQNSFLFKNPNIDGYPDLLDVSTPGLLQKISTMKSEVFLNFPYGGLEVKNTFGVKKAKTHIGHRETRLQKIQECLVWKAHHQETNNLIALQSDYVERVPQIIAIFFADDLLREDWTIKQ